MSVLRAELRRLRPLLVAGCALGGLPTLGGAWALDDGVLDLLVTAFSLAFAGALTQAAFPARSALGQHLAALPLSRARLHGARLSACACVVLAATASLTLGELGRTALGGGGSFAAPSAGLAAVRLGTFVGLAAWVSPWPRLGGLAVGCLGLFVVALRPLAAPGWLDPSQLALGPWQLLAGLGLALAGLRRPGAGVLERCEGALSPLRGSQVLRTLWRVCWVMLLAGSLLSGLRVSWSAAAEPSFPAPTTSVRTHHYQWVSPATLADRARPLIAEADDVYREVVGLLGGTREETPRLRIELVDGVGEAAEDGRIALGISPSFARLQLARLTARELIALETGRHQGLLVQGLTRYVAWRATHADPFWSRFQLAVAHANRALDLGELLERDQLARTRGDQLRGPAGELLVAAWVSRHGDAAVAGLLEVARGGAWTGRAQAEERLAAGGFDLAQAFQDALDVLEVELADDPRAALRLPRLHVLEDMSDMPGLRFVAVPEGAVPEGWTVEARVAFGRGLPAGVRRAGRLLEGSYAFAHPAERGRTRIQVGLRPLGTEPFLETVWEEWVQRR